MPAERKIARVEDESPRIQGLVHDFGEGKILTLGEMTTISHHLPEGAMQKYREEHKPPNVDYRQILGKKVKDYEPTIEMSTIRPQAAEIVMVEQPNIVIDSGAGLAGFAHHIANYCEVNNIPPPEYHATDNVPPQMEIAKAGLDILVAQKRLPVATYSLNDFREGFKLELSGSNGPTDGLALWSLSYSDKDTIQNYIEGLRRAGVRNFTNFAINPQYFTEDQIDAIVDAQQANVAHLPKTEAQQAAYNSANPGGEARNFMKFFAKQLIFGTPIRTEDETRNILGEVAQIVDNGQLGLDTAGTFWHKLKLN